MIKSMVWRQKFGWWISLKKEARKKRKEIKKNFLYGADCLLLTLGSAIITWEGVGGGGGLTNG